MKFSLPSILFATFASLASGLAFADNVPVYRGQTLQEFVRELWKAPTFEVAKHDNFSIVSMRVSTYSGPAFIHRSKLEELSRNAQALAGFCAAQGGQWHYLGTVEQQARPGTPLRQNTAMLEAASTAPHSAAGLNGVVKAGEQGLAADLAAQLMTSMRSQPDRLVAHALEHAIGQKWLGRFECQQAAAPWTAQIAYVSYASTSDRSYLYKEVKLKISLAEKK